jgi:hypothetical protein
MFGWLIACSKADLCLCLGTSLQILPCGALPLLTRRSKGNVVIVNLQTTKRDKICQLRIWAPVDDVMTGVLKHLNIALLPWMRPLAVLHSTHRLPNETLPSTIVDEQLACDSDTAPACLSYDAVPAGLRNGKQEVSGDEKQEVKNDTSKCTSNAAVAAVVQDSAEETSAGKGLSFVDVKLERIQKHADVCDDFPAKKLRTESQNLSHAAQS